MSAVITIRVDDEVGQRLHKLAAATQRSRSFLEAEVLRDYPKLQEWQTVEIEAGYYSAHVVHSDISSNEGRSASSSRPALGQVLAQLIR